MFSQPDTSFSLPVMFNEANIAEMYQVFKSYKNVRMLPLVAFMKKVVSTDLDPITIVRIYLIRSDGSLSTLPTGTLAAFCQLKTPSTQVLIDCVLSPDCIPLEPVWYTDVCEQMIEKYRGLIYPEIVQLATHAHC